MSSKSKDTKNKAKRKRLSGHQYAVLRDVKQRGEDAKKLPKITMFLKKDGGEAAQTHTDSGSGPSTAQESIECNVDHEERFSVQSTNRIEMNNGSPAEEEIFASDSDEENIISSKETETTEVDDNLLLTQGIIEFNPDREDEVSTEMSETVGDEMNGNVVMVNDELSDSDSNTADIEACMDDMDSDINNINGDSAQQLASSLNFFVRPAEKDRHLFFQQHPIQDADNINKAIFRTKEGIPRKWLTFCKESGALCCSICIAFGSKTLSTNDKRHWSCRVDEHEKSNAHRDAVSLYLAWSHDSLIEGAFRKQLAFSKRKIIENRAFLERVIDILKLIGKCGLPYRGTSGNEAAHTLNDPLSNHGVFLELVLLLSKYDKVTENHIKECVSKSQAVHAKKIKAGKGPKGYSKGRGSLVTFLSRNTIELIIGIIREEIKNRIATEVKNSGMFSVQLDTTQDVSVKDQISIVLRYVNEQNLVKERLYALVDGESSSGEYYVSVLKKSLSDHHIDTAVCIGDSTDGASNMQGVYQGFSSLLKASLATHLHTWCHAHVLNLVMGDVTGCVLQATSFFSLMNEVAVFVKASYKRMKKWEKERSKGSFGSVTTKRLQAIGETRWWAKDKSLVHLFGSFGKPQECLYVQVLLTLVAIAHEDNVEGSSKATAKGLIDNLLKYETILTANVFMQIFAQTTPLSKYLQTSGLDLLTAKRLISNTEKEINGEIRRDFDTIKGATDKFVQTANEKIEKAEFNHGQKTLLHVQSQLPKRRLDQNPLGTYRVKVFNVITDTCASSFQRRFNPETNGMLEDLSLLDPRGFETIASKGLPLSSLEKLASALKPVRSTVTKDVLQEELLGLAKCWDVIKLGRLEDYPYEHDKQDESDEDADDEKEIVGDYGSTEHRSHCKNCTSCVFLLLSEYNMLTNAFVNIGLAYRYLLTLSVTQVACERSFSALKVVKTHIRSMLNQSNLEGLMLMKVENDLALSIDNKWIIDKLSEHSEAYGRLLKL